MGLSSHPITKIIGGSDEPWMTTRLDFLVNSSRAKSLCPMPFRTARVEKRQWRR